jgi:PAS domain S-box-containing protein
VTDASAFPGGVAHQLREFLRSHRAALVDRWPAELFDGVTEAVARAPAAGPTGAAVQPAERHALRRLREGAALREVIFEVAGLREAILDLWDGEHAVGPAAPALRLLNQAVDSMIGASSERYLSARDRTLQALDRISSVAFETRRVDDLLQRLLQVIVEPAAAVDTGSILLREGDELVVRAAVGLEEELRRDPFRLRIGDGFAGRIASERRPRLLVGDEIEAEAVSPFLKAQRLRTLYGVPLQSDGQLVGVAHIGSATVVGFSDQDRWLFEAMCARATASISQHLLQEASAARARDLETVLQSIPDAVLVADSHSLHHANRAALELLGVDSVEQLNQSSQSLSEVIEARHPDTGEPLSPDERPIARGLRGETTTTEMMVHHRRTGEDVILLCTVAPVRSGAQIVGAVAACADITQSKREHSERERLYGAAKQAVADRQHVLSVVSHDLRNPLNTILLAAETMKDDGTPAEIREKGLSAITRAAARMNRMISDLLDVNSIEAGRLAINALPQDPLSVVAEVLELLGPQAASRNLSLLKEAPAELPLIRGDRHRLVQALANLVSNALKVSAAEGSVTIRLRHVEREVVFAVIDSGPGIPEEARGRIFDPYWRADNATYKGTGLGLAIVRGIVEGHGGRVWIESEPGHGAAFLFSIPAA